MEVPSYVVDTSVALKWFLSDEQHVQEANQVWADYEQGLIRLLAPEQLRHEVASGLFKATRHPSRPLRLSLAEARRMLENFRRRDLEFLQHEALIPAAFNLAAGYECSYYDGLFLAAAEMTATPFLHADGNLHNALRGRFHLELWIEDYRSPAHESGPTRAIHEAEQ